MACQLFLETEISKFMKSYLILQSKRRKSPSLPHATQKAISTINYNIQWYRKGFIPAAGWRNHPMHKLTAEVITPVLLRTARWSSLLLVTAFREGILSLPGPTSSCCSSTHGCPEVLKEAHQAHPRLHLKLSPCTTNATTCPLLTPGALLCFVLPLRVLLVFSLHTVHLLTQNFLRRGESVDVT